MKVQNICVIGLGSMGMGAAKSCVRAKLSTYGADLNEKALEDLKEYGAIAVSKDARDFADKIDAVLILVVNAMQAKTVLFAGGDDCLAAKLKKGSIVMVSSTESAADAKDIEEKLKAYSLRMLDAPVSGGAAKANLGEMTVMASGSDDVFEDMKDVLDAVASKVYKVGTEIGKGSTVKIIHQLLAGVHIAAGAEAMAMAAKANIDLQTMYDVVTNAAGNSWMFENRMKHVVDGDYTPLSAVDIFVKDLGLVTDTAKDLHAQIPLASTAFSMFTQASNDGYGKEDDSAVIKIFKGITLPEKK